MTSKSRFDGRKPSTQRGCHCTSGLFQNQITAAVKKWKEKNIAKAPKVRPEWVVIITHQLSHGLMVNVGPGPAGRARTSMMSEVKLSVSFVSLREATMPRRSACCSERRAQDDYPKVTLAVCDHIAVFQRFRKARVPRFQVCLKLE